MFLFLTTIALWGKAQNRAIAKKKSYVFLKDYGVVGNGLGDETNVFRKVFNEAISKKDTIVIESGKYIVSGSITTENEVEDGELHIICVGKVEIIVDKNKTFIGNSLLSFYHSTITNCSIKGGTLDINLNNNCPIGISICAFGRINKTNYQGFGGELKWTTPISIKNAFASVKTNGTAAGIQISGVFKKIFLNSPTVENVSRYSGFPFYTPPNLPIDESKGIAITNLKGCVIINKPTIKYISTPNNRDADGIAIFGYKKKEIDGNENLSTLGICYISNAKIYDAQGRGMKFQCTNVIVKNPFFFRKNLVSITQGHDIDFQFGNGKVLNSIHEYRLNNGISPIKLAETFTSIYFQNKLKNTIMLSSIQKATLKTEVQISRFVYASTAKGAMSWKVKINNLKIFPLAPLNTTPLQRAIMEFNADDKEGFACMQKNSNITIALCNINAPNTNLAIGYTGYNSNFNGNKINITLKNVRRENGRKITSFYNLSGERMNFARNLRLKEN